MLVRFEIDDPRWLEFVSANEAATVFHHPAWAGLLADSYRYSAFARALEGGGGRIVAGLPLVDVSNRLTGKRWGIASLHRRVPAAGRAGRRGRRVG